MSDRSKGPINGHATIICPVVLHRRATPFRIRHSMLRQPDFMTLVAAGPADSKLFRVKNAPAPCLLRATDSVVFLLSI